MTSEKTSAACYLTQVTVNDLFMSYIPASSVKVVDPPPKFLFRVVSGPVVYTAISVINALRRSGRRFLSVSPNWTTPDSKYQVHTGK